MPIDFAAIAAQFRPLMVPQVKLISTLIENLAKWLKPHWERTRRMYDATRHFPVLDFYSGALIVKVDRGQFGALGISPDHPNRRGSGQPDLSPWGRLAEAGMRFWDGLKKVPVLVEQELAPARLLRTLVGIAGEILASMNRYTEPAKEMFDLTVKRTASDLIGQAALAWRAVTTYSAVLDIWLTAVGVFAVKAALSGWTEESKDEGKSWVATLDDVVRGIVGMFFLLPLGMALLSASLETAILSIKLKVLRSFTGIEATVLGIRKAVLDFFYDTFASGGLPAQDWMEVIHIVVVENLMFYIGFIRRFIAEMTDPVMIFWSDVQFFFTKVLVAIGKYVVLWNVFLKRDVWDFIRSGVGDLESAVAESLVTDEPPPATTIGQFLEIITGTGSGGKRQEILDWIESEFEITRHLSGHLQALETLLQGPQLCLPGIPAEAKLPKFVAFPDLYKEWFAKGDLPGIIDRMFLWTRLHSVSAMKWGSEMLLEIGKEFADVAKRESGQPSVGKASKIRDFATAFTDKIFGDEKKTIQDKISKQAADPFLGFVRAGGFDLVGAVIPRYVAGVRKYWRGRMKEMPVSPLVLAKRRKLTVRVKTMSFKAEADALDDNLIEKIAAAFKEAVENSYRDGALLSVKVAR